MLVSFMSSIRIYGSECSLGGWLGLYCFYKIKRLTCYSSWKLHIPLGIIKANKKLSKNHELS